MPAQVGAAVAKMAKRLGAEHDEHALNKKEALALRLNMQYPGDVGVLSAFFLNLVELQPLQVEATTIYSSGCASVKRLRIGKGLLD